MKVSSDTIKRKRYARTVSFDHQCTQSDKKLFNVMPVDWFDRILKDFIQDFAVFVIHGTHNNNTNF